MVTKRVLPNHLQLDFRWHAGGAKKKALVNTSCGVSILLHRRWALERRVREIYYPPSDFARSSRRLSSTWSTGDLNDDVGYECLEGQWVPMPAVPVGEQEMGRGGCASTQVAELLECHEMAFMNSYFAACPTFLNQPGAGLRIDFIEGPQALLQAVLNCGTLRHASLLGPRTTACRSSGGWSFCSSTGAGSCSARRTAAIARWCGGGLPPLGL